MFWLIMVLIAPFVLVIVFGFIQGILEEASRERKRLAEEKREEGIKVARIALEREVANLTRGLSPKAELEALDYLVDMSVKVGGSRTLSSSWSKVSPHVEEFLSSENRESIDLAWQNNDVRAVHYHLDGLRYHNGIESSYNLRITSVMCAMQGNVYGAALCLLKSLKAGVPVVKNTVTRCLKEDTEEVQQILSKLRSLQEVEVVG